LYTEKLFCNTVDRLEQIVLGQASPETTFRENKSAEKSLLFSQQAPVAVRPVGAL